MLERESKREKNLEVRAKELRQKEKKQAESAADNMMENKVPWEEQLKEVEEKFWTSVQAGEAAAESAVGASN